MRKGRVFHWNKFIQLLDKQWYAMFSFLKSLKNIKITNVYRSIFCFLFQAQRSTLEHTKVSEEPAKGVQVWWPEGHSSLVTKRLEPYRSQEIKGRHGSSAGEFNNNGNNRSSPKLLLRPKFVQPIVELIECIENFPFNIKRLTLLIIVNIYIVKKRFKF